MADSADLADLRRLLLGAREDVVAEALLLFHPAGAKRLSAGIATRKEDPDTPPTLRGVVRDDSEGKGSWRAALSRLTG